MSLISIDRAIVSGLDTFLAANRLFRILVYNVGENPFFRNLPLFFPLLLFWFGNSSVERRSRILTGLLATCAAVFLSVSMQYLLPVHTRPLLDTTLHLHTQSPNWDHQSSFPSDTAMLYFSLSTVLLLHDRRTGTLAFLWSALSAGLCRVAIGWHYPSDILGSLLIGPTLVCLISIPALFRHRIELILTAMQDRMYIVNAMLVIFLAETYNLFPGLRGIFETLVHLARHNLDIPQ